MNKNILLTLKEFLVTQLNHFNFYIFALTFSIIADSSSQCGELNPVMWFFMGLVPLFLFFIRKNVESRIGFVTCHVLTVLFVLLFPAEHNLFRIIYLVCGVGYCFHSYILKYQKDSVHSDIIIPYVTIGISFLCLALLNRMGFDQWNQYYLMTTIFIICGYFIAYYMDNYLTFIAINESNTEQVSQKKILFSGLKFLLGYVFIGFIILLNTFNSTWLEYIIKPFKDALLSVLRKLFSFLNEERTPLEYIPEEETSEFLAIPDEGTSDIWKFFERIAGIIVTCLFVYIALVIIIKVMMIIRRIIKKKKENIDIYAFLKDNDIREKIHMVNIDRNRFKNLLNTLSYEERIRKSFKKKVKATKYLICNENDDSGLALYTAKEYADMLESPLLADIYEKARYSNTPCNKEDVEDMKKACR